MTDLQIFNNPEFGEIRTVEIDGEGWFVGNDVAAALGYAKPRNAIATHVDAEDARIQGLLTNGGVQQMKVINESGLYALIIMSELPSAKKFKRWVTSEVLPSIRKHGGYNLPQLTQAEMMLQMAQNTVELERQLGEVKQEVKQLGSKFDGAMKTFAAPGGDWVSSMNIKISELVDASDGWSTIKLKGRIYAELESVSNVCLSNRMKRLQTRMKKEGANYRERMAVTKLDVISRDRQLRSIFESIVKRYQATYAQD